MIMPTWRLRDGSPTLLLPLRILDISAVIFPAALRFLRSIGLVRLNRLGRTRLRGGPGGFPLVSVTDASLQYPCTISSQIREGK